MRSKRDGKCLGSGVLSEYIHTQAMLFGGLGCLRSDARNHCGRVRLACDAYEVAHGATRCEEHCVETTGLNRLACLCGRRSSANCAVSGDIFDFPTEFGKPCRKSLGRDIRARQEHAIDRVKQVVVRRPFLKKRVTRLIRHGD